jgi:transcription antitermination factor NusG
MKAPAFILGSNQLEVFGCGFSLSQDVRLNSTKDDATMGSVGQRRLRSEDCFLPEFAPDQVFEPKWFAVYTTSRHEKRVAQHLVQRQIEHYLPLYRSQRKWSDGSRVTLDLPLFPGYLFVHIKRTERVRVLDVPGALAVVGGTGREPVAMPDEAIDALRTGLHMRRVEPHPLLTAGQRARIRSGALAGMEGIVVRWKTGFRVVLTLEHIQRSIAVEVGGEDLEPLGSNCLSGAGFARA